MVAGWEIMLVGTLRDDVVFKEYNRFSGPFWSRSVETYEEEEVECVLKVAPITGGAGAAESSGVNVRCP